MTSVFDHPDFDDHDQVTFFRDADTGLAAIVAIHRSSEVGIAGGGCRMWPYASPADALRDALRLSRAMSYKLALAGLPAGGAKCVVIGDSRTDKSEERWRALGRCIDALGGRFVIAEDVGTTPDDMEDIARETAYVAGRLSGSGDTGEATARGVCAAMELAVERRLGRRGLAGVRIAIQGLGGVGGRLAELARARGGELVVADLRPERCERARRELGATVVSSEEIAEVPVDVLAPCALGDVLTEDTIPRLRCSIVVGSANNQLGREDDAYRLEERDILYVPDFVGSMGGVIGAALAFPTQQRLERALARIPEVVAEVMAVAEDEDLSTHHAAVSLAERALQERRPPRLARLIRWLWSRRWLARVALRTRGRLVGAH